jgi:hypothetical protein
LGSNCSIEDKARTHPPADDRVDLFDRWLSIKKANLGKHVLIICKENNCSCDNIFDELQNVLLSHYVAPEITAKRLAELGAPRTAELLREHLPTTKTARSGDLGEILAIEFTERRLGFSVPIRRLRFKDGRNMALRGDDLIAIDRDLKGSLKFLKGESKSYARLTPTVIKEAADALDRYRGRPNRHSVLFVAERLRDKGDHDLAKDLDYAVLQSFRGCPFEHLLFTVSGTDPNTHLSNHLRECRNRTRRYAVGIYIVNHGDVIERLFSEQ